MTPKFLSRLSALLLSAVLFLGVWSGVPAGAQATKLVQPISLASLAGLADYSPSVFQLAEVATETAAEAEAKKLKEAEEAEKDAAKAEAKKLKLAAKEEAKKLKAAEKAADKAAEPEKTEEAVAKESEPADAEKAAVKAVEPEETVTAS
jgi:outer membrane biosynthesis protein TonB